jgi:hypothetical protein
MCGNRTHPAYAAGLKTAPDASWENIPHTQKSMRSGSGGGRTHGHQVKSLAL